MALCIAPSVLASALANRLEAGGAAATEQELRTLLAAGCTAHEIRGAFERAAQRTPRAEIDAAIRMLDALA